jgi:lipoyl-dependent peroxiredoxin
MTDTIKVLFTAKVHTTGGRDGRNPEQLFAAGWSACFEGAMGIAARKMKISMPAGMAIDAEVDLCLGLDAYFLRGRLNVSLPRLEPDVARELIDSGHHRTCPYPTATRGNIDVLINLIAADSAPLVIVDTKAAPEKRI